MPLSDQILTTNRPSVAGTSEVLLPGWQEAMRRAIRSARRLYELLGLEAQWKPADAPAIASAEHDFPVFVPYEFLARIRPGDLSDPLLRQVLPVVEETRIAPSFSQDPVGDQASERVPGLLQKYHGRALIIATSACAVHCRYCFRRHYPYADSSLAAGDEAVWDSLNADPSIHEVLLSGGDPLTLPDAQIARIIRKLETIDHVRRIRIHTRLPIMIPQRMTEELLTILKRSRQTVWMVVHVNHAQELDEATLHALSRIIDAGVPVMNQAVLLKGVNDSVEALESLCETLVNHRIMPYYLSQLDRVSGAAHFEVPVETGQNLVAALRKRLPGYAMPRYVVETPGQPFKEPLD